MSQEEPTSPEVSGVQPQQPTWTMFTSNVPLPHKLSVKGNLTKNWKHWKKVWEAYEIVTELTKRESNYRVATFITCIGPEALQIHLGLPFANEEEKNDIAVVMKLWDDYCIGKTNVIYERYKFNRNQDQCESIDEYVTTLRSLVETCEFQGLKDELIRDRLVCGIKDNGVRKKLLQESKLTLDRCVDVCRAAEATKNQVREITNKETAEGVSVDKLETRDYRKYRETKAKFDTIVIECKYCGKKHENNKEKCPAYGKKCAKCGKQNHFAIKCKSKSSTSTQPESQNFAKTVNESSDSEEEIYTVNTNNGFDKKIHATMEINGQPVKMQVDSGASCNILPKRFLPPNTEIQKKNKELITYSNTRMSSLGTARVSFRNMKTRRKYRAEFVIVEGNYTPLIGARAAQQMNLIVVQKHNILQVSSNDDSQPQIDELLTKEKVLKEYGDLFKGLGKMEGKLHLEIDVDAKPVVMPPRRVPLAVKDKLQAELQRLEKLGVLAKQEGPTEWVSSLVVTEKPNGKVRVCIDPLHLNKVVKRSHYPLPVIEEILPELAEAKVFTKVDLKDGFLQIELDPESSKLTTFQTPWGRYRWMRLPFGIAPAPENFQQKLDQNLEGLRGVYKIADDILITGQGAKPEKDHDNNLLRLLQRCRERNIKLNEAKFEFKCTSIPFIGHTLTQSGLQPDPSKIEAITKMEKPKDVEAVRRLIGMVMYLAKFLQGLSSVCEPLRRLTHKDTTWEWKQQHDDAFKKIKELVSTAPVLKYFNPTEPTEGQGDASSTGLGFVLTQNDQPVTFASRALTPAETRYSQIEKELLAQVFGLEHNHQYAYGRKITLWTDHKPLVSISRKPLATAPKRLQRLLLRLVQYDAEIHYKPGKEMYVPDTLSRAHLKSCKRSTAEVETEHVHTTQFLPMSEPQITELQQETAKDDTMQCLIETIRNGWPEKKSQVPSDIQPFYNIRDELTTQDGVIFKGQRSVIPHSLRPKIKEKIHSAHTGIQGCLRRARELVYWPGMNGDVTSFISNCDICARYQTAQAKEPLMAHKIPRRPWEKVGIDIFTHKSTDYLCTVDYYSDYFEVDKLSNKTGEVIINKLKKHFATHGIPDIIQSDNGPPFSSREFSSFAESYETKLTTSSPTHSQGNGKVENAVKMAKNLLRKSQESKSDYQLALLAWRNTPTEGLNSSPAQRLFGRRTRTLLPTSKKLLKPKIVSTLKKKKMQKRKQGNYYNRHTTPLSTLKQGDVVRALLDPQSKPKKWFKAKVIQQISNRSYEVQTEDGRVFRRNRVHIRCSTENYDQSKVEETEHDYDFPAEKPIHEPMDINHDIPDASVAAVPPHQEPRANVRRSQRNPRPPSYFGDYTFG